MPSSSKISRLPRPIREELNQRLDDSMSSTKILAWLNSLPEVQAAVTREFDGVPISKGNLHDWRNNQFLHWQAQRNAVEFLGNDDDETPVSKASTDALTRKLSHCLSLRYANALSSLKPPADNPEAEIRTLHELCADIVALRRGELTADRVICEQKRLTLLQSTTDEQLEKLFWEWTKRPAIQAKLYPQRSRDEARREAERVLNFKLLGIPYEAQSPAADEYADPATLI